MVVGLKCILIYASYLGLSAVSLILSYMFSDLDAQLTKWEEIIAQKHTSSSKLRELEQRCSMLEREKVHKIVNINAMTSY